MDKISRDTAQATAAQREVGLKGDHWVNHTIAKHLLLDEIDATKPVSFTYRLDQERRDVLLAHARQDAAHALCNTVSLLNRVRILTQLVYLLLAIAVAILLRICPLTRTASASRRSLAALARSAARVQAALPTR